MEIPQEVGIMVLPETVFFPHNLLPLYIFEPRYREMLTQALASHRMIAIALADKGCKPARVGGIGLIRACVKNADGTSNLILQGIARVEFTDFTQKAPYYIARSKKMKCCCKQQHTSEPTVKKVMDQIRRLKTLDTWSFGDVENFLRNFDDYDTMIDVVAGCFVNDAQEKQALLECCGLQDRLELLSVALEKEYPAQDEGELTD
jgi:Lon protease-like protein